MISQAAEYSLRAVICLAKEPGRPLTAGHIARVTSVPVSYLAKIMQALAKAQIVTSHRGLKGGFMLARDPACLTLLEVVRIVNPSRRIERCPLQIASQGTQLCSLHQRLDTVASIVEALLAGTTIAQVLEDVSGAQALCHSRFARANAKERVARD